MKHLHLHFLLLLSCISLLRCAVVPAADDGGRRRESRALLKWKASLSGGDTYLSSWTTPANSSSPCSWDFITCDSAGDVTGLNITGTFASQDLDAGLRGTLAALDFSAFPRLQTLQLSQNNLYGAIPEGIGNLTGLVSLNISFDFLTGPIPRSIGQLEHLSVLALQFLLLQGRIPDEIGNLTSLQVLELTHNALTGSVIPPAAASGSRLTWLGLSQNSLSGGIPLEIGNMSELRGIDLGYNINLEGPLPNTLSRLGKLRYLLLSNNRFGGDLDSSQLGSNNSNLLQIDVESNDFTRVSARSICAGGALEDFKGNSNSPWQVLSSGTTVFLETSANCLASSRSRSFRRSTSAKTSSVGRFHLSW
ncbi:disease resistance protein BAK6-like [Miscanthus floridulus]|uniref:disease resistance protein BAK6-like n=1 Tax=Miscanthus floridulus TaxID=154761 RepID=UPI0034593A02